MNFLESWNMHIKSVFIKYYADLTKVLFISELSPEFVSAGIISFDEEKMIRNAPTSMEKARNFSEIILSHIDINHTGSFVDMLDIMERKGNMAVADLARKIKSELYQAQTYTIKQDLFSFNDERQKLQQQQLKNIPKLSTNDIMLLYDKPAQSQYSSYTASPFNTINYQQQQQEAALKMTQQSQQHLMEVSAMQAQMANLKTQKDQSMMKMNDGVPLEPQPQHTMPPGQMLNPNPWWNFEASDVDYKENN